MSAWRVTVKRKSASSRGKLDNPVSVPVGWKPTRGRAVRLVEGAGEDRGRWGAEVLFGLWVTLYEKRFVRRWTATETYGWEVVDGLRTLVKRRGSEETAGAVTVLFTQLRWVSSDHLGFLLRESTYERFIVPALAGGAENRKGEQSEWSTEKQKEGDDFWGRS